MQLSENGLFGKTIVAKKISDYSSAKEIIEMELMEVQVDCIENGKEYTIEEIAKNIKEDTQITIEKYYNSEMGSIKEGITENLINLKAIVVSVNKYSEYKFLIGENCKIEGVTEDQITDTTSIEDFKSTEEFEKEEFGSVISNKDKDYYNITKKISEGIEIDNTTTQVEHNKPYIANLIVNEDYALETLMVKMGGEIVEVDKINGIINIESVTGNIEIIATAIKVETAITDPIIGTTTTATVSVEENSQKIGTTLYIKFTATIGGVECTISPAVPYGITKNGTYVFTIMGTYNEKTITKNIKIDVKKYMEQLNLVQYDAGNWTREEIEQLQNLCLYDMNISKTSNNKFKLNSQEGLNFTFGGFTYKGDIEKIKVI